MNNDNIKLVINKEINAPAQSVYEAFTKPELMQQWFAPGNLQVQRAESEPREGGKYLVHMHDPDTGEDHIVTGTYQEVVENTRLVFDWTWRGEEETTLVRLDFKSISDDQTLLSVTHTGFSQQDVADQHNQGWTACLASLDSVLDVEHTL